MLGLFGGIRLIESAACVDGPFEDWAKVRSPGRARRRRKQGHRQNIRIYYTPSETLYHMRAENTVVGHPVMIQKLRTKIEQESR